MIQNAKILGINADPKDYHDQKSARGTPGFRVSPSSLKLFAHCPQRWKNGYALPDSKSLRIGALFDCRLLTPDQFAKRYVIQPATYPAPKDHAKVKKGDIHPGDPLPWNNNANACSDWTAKQEAAGLTIATAAAIRESDTAIATLNADHIIKSFLDESDRQVLVHAEWHDEETGIVIPTQCLIDLVPRADSQFATCLGDLKTTCNAALLPWQRFCFKAGYHRQAAWYLDHYIAATQEDRNTFCFILQENYPPWQPARRILGQDGTIPGPATIGRQENNSLMALYAKCVKTGFWPGYDDTDESVQGWSVVRTDPFEAERSAFSPKYQHPEPESEEPAEAEESFDLTP